MFQRLASRSGWHLLALFGAALALGPFVWMLSSSVKESGAIFAYPPQLIPARIRWDNFAYVIQETSFLLFMRNTVFIAGMSMLGQLFCCSLAGFAFARLAFPYKNVLFWSLMAALIIPPQVTLVPTFILVKYLNWLDTYYPIIIPWFLAGAIGTFLFRQFFKLIPQDLDDAATIDGCGPYRLFLYIYLPLSGPVIATVAVFSLVAQWNNLLGPVIYLSTEEKFPITMGLASFVTEYTAKWNILMAANLLSIVPVVLLYFFLQRYFVEGMLTSGIRQ